MLKKILVKVRRSLVDALRVDLTPASPHEHAVRDRTRYDANGNAEPLMYGGWEAWDGTGRTSWDD